MDGLKRCPFCGGEAALYVRAGVGGRIRCRECDCGTDYVVDSVVTWGSMPAMQQAIERWNRRTSEKEGTGAYEGQFGG